LLWLSELGKVPAVGAGLGYLSSVEMQESEDSRVAVQEKEWEAETYEDYSTLASFTVLQRGYVLPTQPAAYAWRLPGKLMASVRFVNPEDAQIKMIENIQCSNKPPCGVGELTKLPSSSVLGGELELHSRDHGIILLIPMTCLTKGDISNVRTNGVETLPLAHV
jgi:hypothetical protein